MYGASALHEKQPENILMMRELYFITATKGTTVICREGLYGCVFFEHIKIFKSFAIY